MGSVVVFLVYSEAPNSILDGIGVGTESLGVAGFMGAPRGRRFDLALINLEILRLGVYTPKLLQIVVFTWVGILL